MSQLNARQVEVLLQPIKPGRVATRDGQSNVEAYDIRAHLTRMFGFGNWSLTSTHEPQMIYEQPTETRAGKPAFKVAYRATLALEIRDPNGDHLATYTGSAVGESIMPDFKRGDAHDMALKTAESQALKRAAMNLGDQFGLSLYAGGSLNAVVRATLVNPDDDSLARSIAMDEPDVVEEAHDVATAVEPVEESPASVPTQAGIAYEDAPPPESEHPDITAMVTDAQIRKIQVLMGVHDIKERQAKLDKIAGIIGRSVKSSKEMTLDEARKVIDKMEGK